MTDDTKDTTAYTRLRAYVLATIADPDTWDWRHLAESFLLALSGYTDGAWIRWEDCTDATDGQWFVWRDPDGISDTHVDRVMVTDGKIVGKHGCGLGFYPDCQPCRFDDDVVQALKAAGQFS